MNVNDGLSGLEQVLGVAKTDGVADTKRSQSTASSEVPQAAQDRTEWSTAASLASQTMNVPDVRMEKVAAVQQALASGSYQVSASDLADSLIASMVGK